jgi:Zn-dependent protease with chaperone function
LVLPLGFFKLMMREKKEALALIAHELAHIKHKDARLVLSASANYTILRYFVCSWILILPSMLYAIFLVNKEANSAIREEKLKFSQSCGLDASNYSIPCYGSVSDGLGGSLTVGPPSDVERRRLADYRKSLDGQSTLVTSVIGVFFVTVLIGPNVWILALLKKRRRRSEELADMAAVAYSDPDGVRAYLMRIQRQSTLVTRSHFWSLYPSVDRRLALVEKWARL